MILPLDPIYYRILIVGPPDLLQVVQMQAFDETDYQQNRFFTTLTFEHEADAAAIVADVQRLVGMLALGWLAGASHHAR